MYFHSQGGYRGLSSCVVCISIHNEATEGCLAVWCVFRPDDTEHHLYMEAIIDKPHRYAHLYNAGIVMT